MAARVPGHQVFQRIRHRLGERGRHAERRRYTERVAQPPGVLDRCPARLAADPHLDGPALRRQLGQPAGRLRRLGAPVRDLGRRQRPDGAQQVREPFQITAGTAGGQPLELRLGLLDHPGIEQFPQIRLAEQLGEQRRVERERLGTALGQRRVALVHESTDIPEHQRPAERRRCRGLDLHQADLAAGEIAHEAGQRRDVEHVLHALPDGFQHDREGAVLGRDSEQLRGSLPLLPERGTPPRPAARQQQGPGGAFAEP